MVSLKEIIRKLKINRLSPTERFLYDIFTDLNTVIEYNGVISYKSNGNVLFKYDPDTNILWCNNKVFREYFIHHNRNEYDENFIILEKYIKMYLNYYDVKILSIPESLINKENI